MKKPRLYKRKKMRPVQYVQNVYAKFVLERDREFMQFLGPVFAASKSTGCDYFELLTLLNYVQKARPSTILELGSGVSTVVVAFALHRLAREGHKCRFVSMEESPEYHADLMDLVPEELKQYAEILCSPVEDRPLDGGLIARCYANKPQLAYEFVFIDGPQVPKTGGYFDGDILDVLEWNSGPVVAFLDQRIATRKILLKLLPFASVKADREFAKFRIPALEAR